MRSQSLRILLIDDNRHGLVARRSVLEQQGHKVTTATNGQDGLERFQEETFDLVVTDYRMPGMTGQQVIKKIRQEKPKIPIVLLSGYVEALGLEAGGTGADIVLSKGPGEVQEMLRAIARLHRKIPKKPVGSAKGTKTKKAKAG
jgi:CheY-like chemotaxis protein